MPASEQPKTGSSSQLCIASGGSSHGHRAAMFPHVLPEVLWAARSRGLGPWSQEEGLRPGRATSNVHLFPPACAPGWPLLGSHHEGAEMDSSEAGSRFSLASGERPPAWFPPCCFSWVRHWGRLRWLRSRELGGLHRAGNRPDGHAGGVEARGASTCLMVSAPFLLRGVSLLLTKGRRTWTPGLLPPPGRAGHSLQFQPVNTHGRRVGAKGPK